MGVLKSTAWRWSEQGSAKNRVRPLLQTGSALAVVLMLGACSSVPDAINPVEWGKSIGDVFSGDEETAAKSQEPIPGQDEDYPSLSDTPAKPVVTGDKERDALIAGLAADRANAQYSGAGRRQSSAPVNPLQPAQPQRTDQPVIAPAPSTPVASTPVDAPSRESAPTPSAAPASTVSSAPTGSKVADEWNARAPQSGPVPTPVAPPARPDVAVNDAPAGSGDAVMDQYNRRLAEGQGAFANDPSADLAPRRNSNDYDYAAYAGDGSVIVDESQLGGGSTVYGGGADAYGESDNEVLAARLGVRAIDTAGPGINESQIAQIQFNNGSANLSNSDNGVLSQVAQTWKQLGGRLRVIGHASMRTANMSLEEHSALNRRISERRAGAVVSQLVAMGVNADAIYVGADGSADPRYYEGVPAGEAGNRRVEIYLDY